MPLNLTLASRNLFHDRLRFVATTIGIVFSVVLVMVQMGLYLGFGRMVTTMIDHTSADLWVMRHGTKCFEDPSLLSDSKQNSRRSDSRCCRGHSAGHWIYWMDPAQRRDNAGIRRRLGFTNLKAVEHHRRYSSSALGVRCGCR